MGSGARPSPAMDALDGDASTTAAGRSASVRKNSNSDHSLHQYRQRRDGLQPLHILHNPAIISCRLRKDLQRTSEQLEQIKFYAGINSDHADHFTFQLRFRSIYPTTYEVSPESQKDAGFAFCSTR